MPNPQAPQSPASSATDDSDAALNQAIEAAIARHRVPQGSAPDDAAFDETLKEMQAGQGGPQGTTAGAAPLSPEDQAFQDAALQAAVEQAAEEMRQAQGQQGAAPGGAPMSPEEAMRRAAEEQTAWEAAHGQQQASDIDPTTGYSQSAGIDPLITEAYTGNAESNSESLGDRARRQGQAVSEGFHTADAKATALADAIGGGVLEGAFQVNDSIYKLNDKLFGPADWGPKSQFRLDHEAALANDAKQLTPAVSGLAQGIGQFATGMLGLGALGWIARGSELFPWVAKGAQAIEELAQGSKVAKAGIEVAKASAVNATAFDPHAASLSNLIQSYPSLANPITGMLAHNANETDAEGRLKNVLENLGIEGMGAVLIGSLKLFKAINTGDKEAVSKASEDVIRAQEDMRAAAPPAPYSPEVHGEGDLQAGSPQGSTEGQPSASNQVTPGGPHGVPEGEGTNAIADEGSTPPGAPHGQPSATPSTPEVTTAVPRGVIKMPSPMAGSFTLAPSTHDAAGLPAPKGEGDLVYSIIKDGQPSGYVHATISGDTARIEDIYTTTGTGRNALGPAAARSLLAQFQKEHPEVHKLTGLRTTGARNGGTPHGYAEDGGTEVSISIPSARVMAARSYLDSARDDLGDRVVHDPEAGIASSHVDPNVPAASASVFDPEFTRRLAMSLQKDAEMVIDSGGDWKAAVESGRKFATPPNALPYNKMASPDEVENFINQTVASVNTHGWLDEAKGGAVLTDAKLEQTVGRLAQALNQDPMRIMGELAQAGEAAKEMAAHMDVGYLLANSAFQDAYRTGLAIKEGRLEQWGGDLAAADAQGKAQVAYALQALGHANSIRAAGGRIVRRGRKEFAPDRAMMNDLSEVNPDMFAQLLVATGGDINKLRIIAQPGMLRRLTDATNFYYVSNLLYGWKTHVNNIVSNTVSGLVRPAERYAGSFLMKDGGASVRAQTVQQYVYMVHSLTDAWDAAMQSFKLGDSRLGMHNADQYASPILGNRKLEEWRPGNGVNTMVYNGLVSLRNLARLPIGGSLRFLVAADEAAKMITYRGMVGSRAHIEGVQLGKTGSDLKAYVNAKLDAAFDNEGRALDPVAMREAQTTTFSQDLDEGVLAAGARGFQTVAQKFPAVRFLVPFVKTQTNIVRLGIRYTPGLNAVSEDFRKAWQGLKGDTPEIQRMNAAQAKGQAAMGGLFMLVTGALSASGMITGAGPSDPATRKRLTDMGWRPYAFRVSHDDGSTSYIPLRDAIGPFALPFTIAADIGEAMRSGNDGTTSPDTQKASDSLGLSLTKQFADMTYLQGIHQALTLITDPNAGRWQRQAGDLASNMIPASAALRNINTAFVDDTMRDARTIADKMLATVPGLSTMVPPRRDVWGDPVHAQPGLWADTEGSLVDHEMERLALDTADGFHIAGVTPNKNGVDLRDITTTTGRNAFDQLQELSGHLPDTPSLKSIVADVMKSQEYLDAPDGSAQVPGTKLYMLGSVINPYHDKALKYLMATDKNVRDAMYKRVEDVRAAYAAKQRDPNGAIPKNQQLNSVLQNFGMGQVNTGPVVPKD